DEDIVEVYYHESVHEVAKNVVDVSLEGRWAVRQAKGHDEVFEEPIASSESRLPFVAFRDPDAVIGPPEIDLGEDLSGG
ncbi:hypothetical protein MNV49_007997, partial [Pseudohyphozyma bogoriensis]